MAVEDPAGEERRHRRHLIEREAHTVDLDVVGEAVDADLGEMHAGRAVNAERHIELGGGGVEGLEIGMIEVAGAQCRGHDGAHATGLACLAQYRDRGGDVLERHDGDSEQTTATLAAILDDEAVVGARELGREAQILETADPEREAREEHHAIDPLTVGVGEHAGG